MSIKGGINRSVYMSIWWQLILYLINCSLTSVSIVSLSKSITYQVDQSKKLSRVISFYFFWWYWSLNSGLCACNAGNSSFWATPPGLPPSPLLQILWSPAKVWVFQSTRERKYYLLGINFC
jgi:hypothetical protein